MITDASQLQKIVIEKIVEIKNLTMNVMPVKVGAIAKNHFQDNFRQSGFVNNGLHGWIPSKRQSGKGKDSTYKTLLSGRDHLFNGINYIPGQGKVMIENRVPYASVHNEGYTGVQYVRPHKSGRLEAMSLKGRKRMKVGGSNIGGFSRHMKIPKRQFIGESTELNKKIEDKFDSEVAKIIKT